MRQMIFDHVRAAGRAARADISRALGVSAGQVTVLTQELIAAGFLREVAEPLRDTARGRPPVALEVVPEARLVIGIKLSDERHTAVLVDFAGRVIADAALPTQPERKEAADLVEETAALVATLLDGAGVPLEGIAALGVGLSGLVDHAGGQVPWSPLLIGPADLRAAIAARFGRPVHLDNDANLLTLAELWFGAGRAIPDFAVVTIENGVGMGLVLGNRLFRGGRGMGLELGHTKVQLDGALCRCGQRGCLEAYLADYALAREAATALGRDPRRALGAHALLTALYAEAKGGNAAAAAIFHRAGRYLAVGLANVVQLFDPGLIILSGERMRYDYLYAGEVLAETEALTLTHGRPAPPVEIHAWGDMVWARGAAALALSAVTAAALAA